MIVPLPAVVRAELPLRTPLTVSVLAELLVHVWAAPTATLAAMALAGTLAFMVMPLAELDGVIVSVFPSALRPRPLVVSAIVKLLMVMLVPKTVELALPEAPDMVTAALEPGINA